MPDYGEILEFLAKNPPQLDAEKKLHASLLELLAQCLRDGGQLAQKPAAEDPSRLKEALDEQIARTHVEWVHFN